MYKLIQTNDFVYTSRYEYGGGSEDDTIITLIGNKIFSTLGNLLKGKTGSFIDIKFVFCFFKMIFFNFPPIITFEAILTI